MITNLGILYRIFWKRVNGDTCDNDRDNNVLPLVILRFNEGSPPGHSSPCNCDIPRGYWKHYIFWCTHPQRPLNFLSQIITGNVIIHKLSLCKTEIKWNWVYEFSFWENILLLEFKIKSHTSRVTLMLKFLWTLFLKKNIKIIIVLSVLNLIKNFKFLTKRFRNVSSIIKLRE